ncbi:MAG: hypothetical protein AAF456_16095 [Planctomycetota bacterium]
METIREFVADTWSIPEARWIVWTTVLIVSVLIGIYFAGAFRRLALGGDDAGEPVSDLTDFEKMRREGQLDDSEFDTLKAEVRSRENTAEDSS